MKPWLHKKTGHTYWLEEFQPTNATNGEQDGQKMALYMNFEGRFFVREFSEFLEKFEPIKVHKPMYSLEDDND